MECCGLALYATCNVVQHNVTLFGFLSEGRDEAGRSLAGGAVHPGVAKPRALQGIEQAARCLLDSLQAEGQRKAWVYCASGKRSANFISTFAADAKQRGINMLNVAGGITSQPAAFHGIPKH